jgi:hypothetical protein
MLREFTDRSGVAWRVWDVYPTAINRRSTGSMPVVDESRVSSAAPDFADGWLCFESETDKRRLVPIPIGWEFRDPDGLEELCEMAAFKSSGEHRKA